MANVYGLPIDFLQPPSAAIPLGPISMLGLGNITAVNVLFTTATVPRPSYSVNEAPVQINGTITGTSSGNILSGTVSANTALTSGTYQIIVNLSGAINATLGSDGTFSQTVSFTIVSSPNHIKSAVVTGVISGTVPFSSTGGNILVRTSGTNYIGGPAIQFNNKLTANQVDSSATAPKYAPVYSAGSSGSVSGTPPLGMIVSQSFTTPSVGSNVDVVIGVPYNGTLGQLVTINGGLYKIVAVNNTPIPSATINVTNINDTAGTTHPNGDPVTTLPELPVGRMGTYGLGRNWIALPDGRSFVGSDIVGGSSGSPALNNRDSVLKMTENTFLAENHTFVVPGNIGDIRAMIFTANLDVSLGQGPLQVGTPTSIFSCNAPVDDSQGQWTNLTNPILTQSLIGRGPLGQYGTILVNSDTMFRSADGISSLIIARRDFDVWGNTPISQEMIRVTQLDDETLLPNATAIQFDNRVIYGCFPTRGPLGIYHQGLIAINLDPVSSLRGKAPSIYDGLWTGTNVFQLVTGIFNGAERAFSFNYNAFSSRIELWELLSDQEENLFDNNSIPIAWSLESGSKFITVKGKGPFDLAELVSGEIYLSDIRGVVNIQAWFRPDYSNCWTPWSNFNICANNLTPNLPKQQRTRLGLGEPSVDYCDPTTNQPFRIGRTFQLRLQITGAATFMGAILKAVPAQETKFAKPNCDELCVLNNYAPPCEPCLDQGSCLQFPIVFYNLSDNKSYSNSLLSFNITCPDGSIQTIYIPPGTVNYTLPFPPGYVGDYPPLVMGCSTGGAIVEEVPSGATQDQIDALVNAMIYLCAQSIAQSQATCASAVSGNDIVYYAMDCTGGDVITFTGSILPSWISLDTVNNRLVGASNTFTADTAVAATAIAQDALNTWALAAIGNSTLSCQSATVNPCISGTGSLTGNIYSIVGYYDGLISVTTNGTSGAGTWDGRFAFTSGGSWYGSDLYDIDITGNAVCIIKLQLQCDGDNNPSWKITIQGAAGDYSNQFWWVGYSGISQTPDTTYTYDHGASGGPSSITLSLSSGSTSSGSMSCGV